MVASRGVALFVTLKGLRVGVFSYVFKTGYEYGV